MQENNRRLIDEAIESEAVKNSFRLAREFIMLNKKFTLIAMAIFIVLNIFGAVPLLGIVFAVLAGIFAISIQIHVGRTLYGTDNIETYVNQIDESYVNEVLSRHMSTALGVYMGWLIFMVLIFFLLGLFLSFSGAVTQNMSEEQMLMVIGQYSMPIIIIVLLMSYVQPLVHSNIILANSFTEGLKAVFTIFSKDVWRSAMQKIYFVYIAKVGILISLVLLVTIAIVVAIAMTPGFGILLTILMLALMYLFMIFMSLVAMMARRMVEE
jgi:hypothetical protein